MRVFFAHTAVFFALIALMGFFPEVVLAQDGFTPLQPEGGVVTGENETFSEVLTRFFQIFISGAAILTVIMITIGGFKYMTSDAFTDKKDAKDQIWNAIIGLFIVLGAVLILNTINPNILNFDFFRGVEDAPQQESQDTGHHPPSLSAQQQWCFQSSAGKKCSDTKSICEGQRGRFGGGPCTQE